MQSLVRGSDFTTRATALDQRAAQAAPSPPKNLWEDPLGSLGKIVAALAGAGVFLYLIGVAVLWQRLAIADLRPEEVIAALPRDQIAVIGAREALLLAILGGIFGLYLYVFYRLFRACERMVGTGGPRARLAGQIRKRPAVIVTAMVAAWCGLLVPLSAHDLGLMLGFLAVVFFGLRSAHRSLIGTSQDFRTSRLPWLRVAAGLSASVFLVSIAHERQFPERFATAEIVLDDSREAPLCGLYLGATSDAVVLGQSRHDPEPGRVCGGQTGPGQGALPRLTNTKLITRSHIERLTLTSAPRPNPPAASLLRRLGVPLDCLAPDCQIGSRRRGMLEPIGIGG